MHDPVHVARSKHVASDVALCKNQAERVLLESNSRIASNRAIDITHLHITHFREVGKKERCLQFDYTATLKTNHVFFV
jgi:hypothetical protein